MMLLQLPPKTWVLLLGFLLQFLPTIAADAGAATQSQVSQPQHQNQDVNLVLRQMAAADVVYLAETHDRLEDHQAQLEILRSLQQQRSKLVIAMEMFQRPYQAELDRFIDGQITEAELVQRTEYMERWRFPWKLYAPILRFAQAKQLPVIALNVPAEVTRKVARAGIDGLTPSEKQWLPPQLNVSPANVSSSGEYRQRLRRIYDLHQSHGNSASFERFLQAQIVWDEAMAAAIVQSLEQKPDALVVVLVGQGHVLYADSIPDRVARQVQARRSPLKQISVALNPEAELQAEVAADYFWYSPSARPDVREGGSR